MNRSVMTKALADSHYVVWLGVSQKRLPGGGEFRAWIFVPVFRRVCLGKDAAVIGFLLMG